MKDIEIENVAKAVENNLEHLVKEMEMEYSVREAVNSLDSTRGIAYTVISDFAHVEHGGTRHKLAKFLRSANLTNTSLK